MYGSSCAFSRDGFQHAFARISRKEFRKFYHFHACSLLAFFHFARLDIIHTNLWYTIYFTHSHTMTPLDAPGKQAF